MQMMIKFLHEVNLLQPSENYVQGCWGPLWLSPDRHRQRGSAGF